MNAVPHIRPGARFRGRQQVPLPGSVARELRRRHYAGGTKRLLDVAVSLVLIAGVLSWLTPVLFMLIRLESKGPLFFIQLRTGRDGRVFPCLKFRSMHCGGAPQPGASRVTRIGAFLRASHIDELPQLINVLLNQMSLVGPRPHMLVHDALFARMVPGYRLRQQMKPGITGLAQAWGYHGTVVDHRSIAARTRLDLFYVDKASLGLDLRILFRTLFVRSVNRLNPFRQYDQHR